MLAPKLCTGCATCVYVCMLTALSVSDRQLFYEWRYDSGQCTFCGRCVEVCPTHALKMAADRPPVYRQAEELLVSPARDGHRSAGRNLRQPGGLCDEQLWGCEPRCLERTWPSLRCSEDRRIARSSALPCWLHYSKYTYHQSYLLLRAWITKSATQVETMAVLGTRQFTYRICSASSNLSKSFWISNIASSAFIGVPLSQEREMVGSW